MEKKFNAESGRRATYYPCKKFVIGKINPDGTLDLATGTWKTYHVKDACRQALF